MLLKYSIDSFFVFYSIQVKLLVYGNDAAMVSCCVLSLVSLLKPLQWVSPSIPILPIKHIDFIDAPVPIIAGIVIDNEVNHANYKSINAVELLERCDSDSITAILDLNTRDIYLSNNQRSVVNELIFPFANELLIQVEEAINDQILTSQSLLHPTSASTHKQEHSSLYFDGIGKDKVHDEAIGVLYSATPSSKERCRIIMSLLVSDNFCRTMMFALFCIITLFFVV